MSEMDKKARRFKFDTADDGAAWGGVDVALAAVACVVYVGARVWRLGATCLWFDEIFGVHAAAWHGWAGMWRFVALDLIHPPLFYALLKVWAGLVGAESAWRLRLLAVALSCAAAGPLAMLGRELGLRRRVVGLALMLAASSGLLIKYARELRMYSLLLLCAACSLWLFARLCNAGAGGAREQDGAGAKIDDERARDDAGECARDDADAGPRDGVKRPGAGDARARDVGREVRRAAVALFAANVALIYAHYFGWLLVGLEALFAAWMAREKLKAFGASVGALALCFAPWAWGVWRASASAGAGLEQNIGWAERPRALELVLPYLALAEPFRAQRQSNEPAVLAIDALLALLLFAPPLAALCLRVFARKRGARSGEGDTREEAATRDGETTSDAETTRDRETPRDTTESRGPAGTRGPAEARVADSSCEARALAFLIFFSFAPVLVAFALARLLPQSIWGLRHLIVVAPAFLLLVALSVERVRSLWLAVLAKVLLGCWLAMAAAAELTSRAPAPVWCAWDALALEAARDEEAQSRGVSGPRGALTIYAFEDLVGYQMWHALAAAGEQRVRVAVVRGAPGVEDDRAFFLPRGFDGVAVETPDDMTREGEFWIALRGARWDDEAPLIRLLRARGYDVEPRHEFDADGQKAFVALARRR